MRGRGLKPDYCFYIFYPAASPPMRGRGLKHADIDIHSGTSISVAPHAGAWIETRLPQQGCQSRLVAPHAGAWIETYACGYQRPHRYVAPHAGAWIETKNTFISPGGQQSPPMRGRGLKHLGRFGLICPIPVAPHAGAWIETSCLTDRFYFPPSPPMRGRGLKQILIIAIFRKICRPPCGGVD